MELFDAIDTRASAGRLGEPGPSAADLERLLRAAGCPKINLQVRANNTKVIAFYERLGFVADELVNLGKKLEND